VAAEGREPELLLSLFDYGEKGSHLAAEFETTTVILCTGDKHGRGLRMASGVMLLINNA
jgi:hypothetical protein